ncbi:MAG: sigma-E processing peptidase SpoIIGA [Clostridia bacterium]|nr:sigma-E processing peptidase SpoIIGA [Clostridia bacterium]
MRISGWLFLMQQAFSALAVITAAARRTGVRLPAGRCALLALATGGLSLAACCGSVLLPCCAACAACAAAAAGLPRRYHLRLTGAFIAAVLMSAGLMRLLHTHLPPLWIPAGCTALLLIRPSAVSCPPAVLAEIRLGAHRVTLSALTDTGNLLHDPLTGLPVIVCARKALTPLCPAAAKEPYPPGMRLISVRTVAGSALMPVFRPDSLRIRQERAWREVRAVIGLAPIDYRGCQTIVPATLTGAAGYSSIDLQGGA